MFRSEPIYHPMRPRTRSPKRVRRRIFRTLFKTCFTIALVCFAAYALSGYFTNSDRFSLRVVNISGIRSLTEDEVVNAAGLNTTLNTLLLDKHTIEHKVAALPYVESCTVRREIPNRVFIDITERQPSAIFLYENHTFEMDREGRLLRELDPLHALYLPLLSSDEVKALPAVGEQLDLPGIRRALELIDVYYATTLKDRIKLSEIAVHDPNTILLFADNLPYEMRWGREDFYAQAQRLEALLDTRNGELPCAEYLDLRFGADLICK